MEEKELLELVKDDLIFLREKWDNEITDSSLRRSSNVLRNLITYDLIGKAARKLSLDYFVESSSIERKRIFELFEPENITLYAAGGAKYGSLTIQNSFMFKGILTPDKIKDLMEIQHPEKAIRRIKLESYKSLPSLIIDGELISKNDLIQYIANKKGGTHLDHKRNNNARDSRYILIDNIFNKYEIAEKKIAYYELLSIGQEIANSDYTNELIYIIENVLQH